LNGTVPGANWFPSTWKVLVLVKNVPKAEVSVPPQLKRRPVEATLGRPARGSVAGNADSAQNE